jgi:hypothetical protein
MLKVHAERRSNNRNNSNLQLGKGTNVLQQTQEGTEKEGHPFNV